MVDDIEPNTNRVVVELSIVFEKTSGYLPALNGDGIKINCYYKFTGGTDGNGNVVVTSPNQKTNIIIKLSKNDYPGNGTAGQFDIVTGFWKNDPKADMSFEIKGRNRLKIIDKADDIDDQFYSVVVTPQKGPKRLIVCDPRVVNDWNKEDEDTLIP